jgi:hypothetical protein
LSDDGTCLLVEPFAGDQLEDNLTPIGRTFCAGSTMLCTPGSRAQPVGLALGAQAGESRLRDVLAAGFSRVRPSDRHAVQPRTGSTALTNVDGN